MADIELLGVKEFAAALEAKIRAEDLASKAFVVSAAHMIEAAAKKNFEGSHRKGEPHQGGSKPNVVTGTLRRSIRVFGPNRIGKDWVATVGPTAVYGRAVELGLWQAPDVSYPYFTPAFEETAPKLAAAWAALAGSALKVI